ncbi:GDP-fucose transporter 1 [Condylostylus longicornis]|uniref:GDP-fucose transporter 1 n=1 Tax=Condylostylus longicornis TaxID=2530218 RepID=UPI00244E0F5A|nr:GDP-fucose transporter 1 [Condylostylus longicornis]
MYDHLEKSTLKQKYIKIFLVVSAYWFISISTVFINKALFASSLINLDAPLFVTWFQCLLSTLICFGMSIISKCFPAQFKFPDGNPIDFNVSKKVLPLSILFTCQIAANNLCLKYVGVAFYYVGRSLTTVFNVVFSLILLGQKTSLKCIWCCAAIIFGFWLGVDQESLTDSFSLKGTLLGVLGSLTLSLYSIYTKKILPHVNQEIWLLSYYNNFYSCFLFIPLIILNGELSNIVSYENLGKSWFWSIMIVGGVCGFSIGIISVLQIKVTSPLTHNISGTAKACAQTVIATQWYSETKSFLWWMSNLIVLGGSAMYARVKQLEMSESQSKSDFAQKI